MTQLIFILLLASTVLTINNSTVVEERRVELSGFVSSEQIVDFKQYPNPYQIYVERINTTTPDSALNCRANGRKLHFKGDEVLLRMNMHTSEMTREESIYKSLTTLDSDEEIVEFETMKNYFYVITSQNKIYRLRQTDGKLQKDKETRLPEKTAAKVRDGDFFVLVIDFAPLLIFPDKAILCTDEQCQELRNWMPINEIAHASFMQVDSKRYILLAMNTHGFRVYELTSSNDLSHIRTFTAQDFGRQSVQIHDVNGESIEKGQIYVLDYESGLYSFKYTNNQVSTLKLNRIVLNHSSCFGIDINGFKYFVLNCRAGSSDYLLEVFHASAVDSYVTAKPMYKYQTILDVDLTDRYYSSMGRSGFKFYWVSPEPNFPADYKLAGELFLHNSVKARFKDEKYLYYATSEALHRIEIVEKEPFASCSSQIPTDETYRVTYSSPCPQDQKKICQYVDVLHYKAWQHKQLSLFQTIVPTIFSFFFLLLVAILIWACYRRYNKQEEQISLKMANSANEFALDSNR